MGKKIKRRDWEKLFSRRMHLGWTYTDKGRKVEVVPWTSKRLPDYVTE
jgi:hypothetical protein